VIDVTIMNFQSIDVLHFEIDGFTALVGRSNIGKSSIVRALKCALTGSSSPDDVRHDIKACGRYLRKTKKCQCFSSVKLAFEDGPSMLWEKGDAINRYTVWKDGIEQVYDSVGKEAELPDFVGEQFSPVKMGSKHSLLQVSDQFDPLFLLDLQGTAVADTLSDLGQLDAVNKALTLAAKDRRSATSTRKVREGDHTAAQAELARYAGLDYRSEGVRVVQASHAEVQRAAQKVRVVRRLLDDTERIDAETGLLSRCLRSELPELVALVTVSSRREMARTLDEGWSSRAHAIRGLMKAVEAAVPEVAALAAVSRSWAKVDGLSMEFASRTMLVDRLDAVGSIVLPDADGLRAVFRSRQAVTAWLSSLHAIKTLFDKSQKARTTTDATFEFDRAAISVRRLRELDGLQHRLVELQSQVSLTEKELNDAELDETRLLDEFAALGVCPTCSQPITPAHAGRGKHAADISVSD
jgi:hypothetical protein